MSKLPTPSKELTDHLLTRAHKRYEACLNVFGVNDERTKQAKKTLNAYTSNAEKRGYSK